MLCDSNTFMNLWWIMHVIALHLTSTLSSIHYIWHIVLYFSALSACWQSSDHWLDFVVITRQQCWRKIDSCVDPKANHLFMFSTRCLQALTRLWGLTLLVPCAVLYWQFSFICISMLACDLLQTMDVVVSFNSRNILIVIYGLEFSNCVFFQMYTMDQVYKKRAYLEQISW